MVVVVQAFGVDDLPVRLCASGVDSADCSPWFRLTSRALLTPGGTALPASTSQRKTLSSLPGRRGEFFLDPDGPVPPAL